MDTVTAALASPPVPPAPPDPTFPPWTVLESQRIRSPASQQSSVASPSTALAYSSDAGHQSPSPSMRGCAALNASFLGPSWLSGTT
jgi:hypothetical protein